MRDAMTIQEFQAKLRSQDVKDEDALLKLLREISTKNPEDVRRLITGPTGFGWGG
ncbi:MAG: hypothetical protein Kow0047_13450 [Anaerolineae bacterium]